MASDRHKSSQLYDMEVSATTNSIPAPAVSAAAAAPAKVKPCCVCTTQKAERDECLLYNGTDSSKCGPIIQQYKACMQGYGFNV